ncbi:MAG: recombinase family protein [Eubacterium sp.]|nr:recombinase family protein [Eubacterium sp.]
MRSIIEDLHSKGINNNGKPFTYHFINWMLNNRRYLGEYSFKGTLNTAAIPPIVTKELFDKCQKRLSDNKHKSASFRKVKEKYYLTGKIFCGCCGDTMSGVSGTSKDKSRDLYRYYQCMTSKRHRCDKKIVRKDFVENIVTSAVMDIFKDKKLVKRICNTCYSLQNTESAELPALKHQLKQVNKEIDNVMNAIKKGIITKSTKSTLEKLEQQQEELERAISIEKIKRPVISKEHIEAWIMRFAKTDLTNAEQKQRLIDVFVNSVHVYKDKMVVFLNYRDGEKCVRLSDFDGEIKKPNTSELCSTLVTFGDPYGN